MKKGKDLKDVTGQEGLMTVKAISEETKLVATKVSQILKDAGIEPVGKIPKRDPISKRPSVGKPMLAFERETALKAIQNATGIKVGLPAAS